MTLRFGKVDQANSQRTEVTHLSITLLFNFLLVKLPLQFPKHGITGGFTGFPIVRKCDIDASQNREVCFRSIPRYLSLETLILLLIPCSSSSLFR